MMEGNGNTITFRKAQAEDREFLLGLYSSTREDIWNNDIRMSDDEKKEFVFMQFHLQDTHYKKYYHDAEFLIIVLNNKDIGRLYLLEMDEEFRVVDITIDPSFRSKGIGNKVMTRIIDKAVRQNKAVSIHVEKNNRALHLYHRLGFQIEGGTEVYHLMKYRSKLKNTITNKPSLEESISLVK